ncbi:MAG TPA: hypothetical protein VK864_12160, partial [Longimicrobiales bacterium]|nr:hypothetical protein [Longimicrobiales bacterium]
MTRSSVARSFSVLLIASAVLVAAAADPDGGMTVGAPNVKSLGAMTFGPNHVLFIGDSESGSIL